MKTNEEKIGKKESDFSILERKMALLKELMLLVHPAVSHFIVDKKAVTQWAEFVRQFPDEGEVKRKNKGETT